MTEQSRPRIIACTDGSVYAASVYDHAAWAAGRINASLEILHVLDHKAEAGAAVDLSGALQPNDRRALLAHLADLDAARAKVALLQGRGILEAARTYLADRDMPELITTLRHGTLLTELAALEAKAEMVVIGKRGIHADFDSLHLGSKLERVIRSSHRPVLVASRTFRPINRVLIAFDGGASTRKAVDYAATSRLFQDLEIHLLMIGRDKADHRDALAQATKTLTDAGRAVKASLRDGDVESDIGDYVRDQAIDLLVVGAYGHSRVRNMIVGSTTTALIQTCLIPLMMFR